ncbi:tRNA (adenosine(37)-N6)-dimethylallyltransferase MiaA [Niveibacterium sp. 24ML]|uniref:tRNA (adenosine(37)-N6)-dimethylallyltransferase MiaA n=1 Tax=Niveibacterium sp. 24ML TaxID=2985512 RepID=UPI00226F0CF1|nr:tRNA (adenosine(37)-N6)-dimethylallyltransferase MiaA [Niveibacterium sp. 24ML]MCX9155198.1 tRNA (adenosine(37)-N6)-dimethylallyltransferase MiaA [Niveibacterium sp. 24ML]
MSSPSSRPDAIALIGPTASGKTACALALARHLDCEIISVDSALVFRDMNIGTAKPTPAEQQICLHHLIDVIDPTQAYSAAQFRADAIRLIGEIRSRGRLPLLVGGTMLYLKALRDGLSDLPQADADLRAEIDREAAHAGWPAMHAKLALLDPDAAARLDPGDAQRIQRALEIVRLTGRPLAENYAKKEANDAPAMCVIALDAADRSLLHARIKHRFDQMLDGGLIEEVLTLKARYALNAEMPSMRCVGYRQVWEHLDGAYDFAGLRERGLYATRQLAKRQITWQRKFSAEWPELTALDCLDPALPDRVRETVERALNHALPSKA